MQSWYYDYDGLMFYTYKNYSKPHRTVRTSDGLGFFFDDQWSPTKRLTLNLGLRYDHMTAKFGPGQMLEQPASPAAWKEDLVVTRDRLGSGNLFDFKNCVAAHRSQLRADEGPEDRFPGQLRPVLYAHRRRELRRRRPRPGSAAIRSRSSTPFPGTVST